MAIAVVQTLTASTVSGTSITFSSWTPAANELLLVAVALRDETIAPSVAGNGLTWVSVANVDNVQNQCGINLFRALGASPSAGAITITLTGNSNPASAVAFRLSGVNTGGANGSGAVENVATNIGPVKDSEDMKTAVTTLTPSAWAIGFGTHRRKTFTVPSGETSISINNHVGSSGEQTSCSVWYESVATPITTMVGANGDLSNDVDWCMIAVSISSGPINLTASPSPVVSGSIAIDPSILTTGTRVFEPPAAVVGAVTTSPAVIVPSPTLPWFVLSPQHEIWICDPRGNRLAFIDQILNLTVVRTVNQVGEVHLELPGDFDQSLLQLDSLIEVWRSPYLAGALRLEAVGLMRYFDLGKNAEGLESIVIAGPDQVDLLRRRIVAYAAGSAYAAKTDILDDMMKAIVRENLGSLATDATRNLTSLSFTVAGDTSDGPSATRSFAWKNVLEALQGLSDLSVELDIPIYFDVIPRVISQTKIGFEFRTYKDLRGQDRTIYTDPLFFDTESGALVDTRVIYDYRDEVNYFYTGGQGEGSDRTMVETSDTSRTGASPWNRREAFADARNEDTTAGVTSKGQEKLQEGKPLIRFAGSLVDTSHSRYGIDWDLGDKIPVAHMGRQFNVITSSIRWEINSEGNDTVVSRFEVVS